MNLLLNWVLYPLTSIVHILNTEQIALHFSYPYLPWRGIGHPGGVGFGRLHGLLGFHQSCSCRHPAAGFPFLVCYPHLPQAQPCLISTAEHGLGDFVRVWYESDEC